MNKFLLAVLFLAFLPYSSMAQEIKSIEKAGKYEGKIVSMSRCKLSEGDRRYCKNIDIKEKSGKIIRSQFFSFVKLTKNNKVIYSGPDTSKSQVEQDNFADGAIKKNLSPGKKVRITVDCAGDEGCGTTKIEVLK